MEKLNEKLQAYEKSDMYPFHMPGHKRKQLELVNPYGIDITEIDGFDNLHHAQEILLEAQRRAADLYHAKQSFFLVNGSTCGLLAAICCVCKQNDRILVARNSHKAVYHAIELKGLKADYLYPEIEEHGICGQIHAHQVQEALDKCSYAAVVITSPTYDGVVSDIAEIARLVHKKDIPLIVDEAHGAHFGMSIHFPNSSITQGADLVIQSMHKTLPSYTQTALLHLCSNRISAKDIEHQLDIFETSSPSYIFMAGMESCISLLTKEKESLFEEFWEKLVAFYQNTRDLKHLHVLSKEELSQHEAYTFDASKILIFTNKSNMTGKELYETLRGDYHLQLEMASLDYCLAMTSIMDTQEGFDRLCKALHEIDAMLSYKKEASNVEFKNLYTDMVAQMTILDTGEKKKEWMRPEDAIGKVSGEYIYLYPPGIPLVTPGELITQKNINDITYCKKRGLEVIGVENGKMCTLVF